MHFEGKILHIGHTWGNNAVVFIFVFTSQQTRISKQNKKRLTEFRVVPS
jgi:hypothetical protein